MIFVQFDRTPSYEEGSMSAALEDGIWFPVGNTNKLLLKRLPLLELASGYYPDRDLALARLAVSIIPGEILTPEAEETEDGEPAPLEGDTLEADGRLRIF